MGSNSVKTGIIQMSCSTDKQANIDKSVAKIREAAAMGAQKEAIYVCRQR